jgi:hypothetical protein
LDAGWAANVAASAVAATVQRMMIRSNDFGFAHKSKQDKRGWCRSASFATPLGEHANL